MAELRRMKNRLRDELEQLLADNAFTPQIANPPLPPWMCPKRSTSRSCQRRRIICR